MDQQVGQTAYARVSCYPSERTCRGYALLNVFGFRCVIGSFWFVYLFVRLFVFLPLICLDICICGIMLILLRKRNWRFDTIGGIIYWLLVVSLFPLCHLPDLIEWKGWTQVCNLQHDDNYAALNMHVAAGIFIV